MIRGKLELNSVLFLEAFLLLLSLHMSVLAICLYVGAACIIICLHVSFQEHFYGVFHPHE